MDNKTIETGNPYKGLFSYMEHDKDLFFGRKREQRDLARLVRQNFLTVVFGKSGIGKTSLLNAGLSPKIRKKGFLPIPLRPDYSPSAAGLLQQVRDGIKKELDSRGIQPKVMDTEKEAEPLAAGETLWEYFHRARHLDGSTGKEITPVLVLDQFEEIFTLGKNHPGVEGFLDELYYLIEDQFPQSVKQRLLDSEDPFPYIDSKPNVRVVITLREDYLAHLNGLKSRIRSIDQITFRVLHFNGRQGREIIGMPGGIRDENVVDSILHMFYPEDSQQGEYIAEEKLEIEPSILSLLCFQLFQKEKEGADFNTKTDKNQILKDFYYSVTAEFPNGVETFIESNLLTEGGFRTPYYLERSHPMRETVDTLVDRRILRKVHYGEKEHIEIIHDVLAPVIKEKRNIRLEEERKQAFLKELQRKRLINRVIIIAGIISILLAVFAFVQTNIAIEAKKSADIQIIKYRKAQANRLTSDAELMLPIDNIKALRIAEAAYKIASPDPPARLLQVLINIQAVTPGHPFYSVNMQHNNALTSAVFSPDGSRILTASYDKTAKLWDLKGNLLAQFKHEKEVYSAVFSPDGSRILTTSGAKTATLLDLKGKDLAQFKHEGWVKSAVFSPDGNRILTASYDNTAKLWDLKGKDLAQFKHRDWVNSAVFSPDGSRILTASQDETAKLWDLKGEALAQFKHEAWVNSAVFSPTGSHILTASQDKTAKLWDLKGIPIAQFKHEAWVISAVFSPDGSRILTTSLDKTAKLWDLKGIPKAQFNHEEPIRSAVFSPDGSRILTASQDNTAKLWDLKGNPLVQFKHKTRVNSAVFSPDGSRILTASPDKTAKLWDVKVKPKEQFKHKTRVNSAVFSPDGSRILTASYDNTAKLWDLKGNPLVQFKHAKAVLSAVFSPDGSRILTASYDNTAKLWNLKGKALEQFKHNDYVYSAVFSPDGSRILTASEDKTAKLWDLKGKALEQFNHKEPIRSAVFSPDGSRILTASYDNTAKLWDLKGNPLVQFNHKEPVRSAVFSPDGSRILTASYDITAKLWDLKGNPLVQFKHAKAVLSAVFSPDGSRILTASYDNTAKLWDLKGNPLAQFKHEAIVTSAVFSPDGSRILTVSLNNTTNLQYTPDGFIQWLKTADIPQLAKEDKDNLGLE